MNHSPREPKIVTPHEFRTYVKTDPATKLKYTVINHYDHNILKEELPIRITNEVVGRQFCNALNKVFKLGIGWGYNFARLEKMPESQQLVLTEDDVTMDVDLQAIEGES